MGISMIDLRCRWYLASKDRIIHDRVQKHERKDENTLSPEHECETGMRRCCLVDSKHEGDHVRPKRDCQSPKGCQENQCDHRKGQFIPAVSNTDCEYQRCDRADHGKHEQ